MRDELTIAPSKMDGGGNEGYSERRRVKKQRQRVGVVGWKRWVQPKWWQKNEVVAIEVLSRESTSWRIKTLEGMDKGCCGIGRLRSRKRNSGRTR